MCTACPSNSHPSLLAHHSVAEHKQVVAVDIIRTKIEDIGKGKVGVILAISGSQAIKLAVKSVDGKKDFLPSLPMFSNQQFMELFQSIKNSVSIRGREHFLDVKLLELQGFDLRVPSLLQPLVPTSNEA